MKYKLYFWNPWDFGRWMFEAESENIDELLDIMTGRSITYIITEDDEVVGYKMATSNHWRYGMVHPKIPERYPA